MPARLPIPITGRGGHVELLIVGVILGIALAIARSYGALAQRSSTPPQRAEPTPKRVPAPRAPRERTVRPPPPPKPVVDPVLARAASIEAQLLRGGVNPSVAKVTALEEARKEVSHP